MRQGGAAAVRPARSQTLAQPALPLSIHPSPVSSRPARRCRPRDPQHTPRAYTRITTPSPFLYPLPLMNPLTTPAFDHPPPKRVRALTEDGREEAAPDPALYAFLRAAEAARLEVRRRRREERGARLALPSQPALTELTPIPSLSPSGRGRRRRRARPDVHRRRRGRRPAERRRGEGGSRD